MNQLAKLATQKRSKTPNALAQAAMPPQQTQQTMAEQVSKPDETDQASGHFNGSVNFQGKEIKVKNSVAEYGGEKFIVSDDGRLVVNAQRQLVGIIQDGNFVQATPEIINQLKQQGVFENEQPQGMAAQTPQ